MVKVQRLFAKTNLKIPVCRTEYSVHSRLVFKRNQAAISTLKEVFAMSETDYNARLYEKMKAEQDKYRDWLLHQEPPEILNHTYESYLQKVQVKICYLTY